MPIQYFPLLLAMAVSLAACTAQPPTSSAATTSAPTAAPAASPDELLARGDYLVRTAGCNDCHTPGYAEHQGNIDRAQWLVGSPLGYNGPWGTTYAANLRLRVQDMTEPQWMEYSAHLRTRPIMPDFNLRAMSEDDRRAIYRFIHSLGPAGQPAPGYLPPGQTPPRPYLTLVLPAAAATSATAAAPPAN